jgi:hypothetical protein
VRPPNAALVCKSCLSTLRVAIFFRQRRAMLYND